MADQSVWMDEQLPEWLDLLGSAVSAPTPTEPVYNTIGNATGDEALVLLLAEARSAAPNVVTQVEILRNEMRLTALGAIVADRYTMIQSVEAPQAST